MILGTDVSNFMQNNGGYNCEHKWRPVPEDQVPEIIKKRVYASDEYKAWKGIDAKQEFKVKSKQNTKNSTISSILLVSKIVDTAKKDALKNEISVNTHVDIKKYQSGGMSAVHKNADKNDLKENIITVELYAKLEGYVAIVNEHIKQSGVKNPELTLNGFLADNKIPNHSDFTKGTEPYKNIRSAISNATKSAIKQNAIPIVVLEKRYSLDDIITGVKYGFLASDKNGKQVNEIHLRYREEGITMINRAEYLSGDYDKKIRDGYKPPLK